LEYEDVALLLARLSEYAASSAVEFAVAAVALHAGADLERPFGSGRVRRPALGEIGLDEFPG